MKVSGNLIYNEIDIRDFLIPYKKSKVYYCANMGNAGDALIAYATYRVFDSINLDYEKINSSTAIENSIIFYAGGGNLTEYYTNCLRFLKNNLEKNREIIILPHTVTGHSSFLKQAPDNLKIICREKYSYQYLSEIFPHKENIFLSRDMAFHLDLDEFRYEKSIPKKKILNSFRQDIESTSIATPLDNIDLSKAWSPSDWRDPNYTKEVVKGLVKEISSFQAVKTNRLHIAILASLLNKKVHMYSNSYFKNKAVFEYSLKEDFKNVTFIDPDGSNQEIEVPDVLSGHDNHSITGTVNEHGLLLLKEMTAQTEKSELYAGRECRRLFTEVLLEASTEDFCFSVLYELEEVYQKLFTSRLQHEPLDSNEKGLVEELTKRLNENTQTPDFLKYLLLLSTYQESFHVNIQNLNLELIPDNILDLVLRYLFQPPSLFRENGESNQYLFYLSSLTRKILEQIRNDENKDSVLCHHIESYFVKHENFIRAYFNDENLIDLYSDRASIIESFLKSQGYTLNYDFFRENHGIVDYRKRIRVGFLCNTYSLHTETYTVLPAFEYLDRNKFEVILFYIHATNKAVLKYCSWCVDKIIQLPVHLIDQVQLIRSFTLDFLFIGTNITAVTNNILLLGVHRLAAVQATLYSSPVTTGVQNIDYYISGKLSETPHSSQRYNEKLVTLDGTGYCFNYLFPSILDRDSSEIRRSDLGVDEATSILFSSGANFYKIIPEVRSCWAEILSNVPNSSLMIYPFSPSWSNRYESHEFIKDFQRELELKHVDPKRLIVLDPLPNREVVKKYLNISDIYLDSFPYTGSHSTLDALEVNLPTVVFEGTQLRSRQSAALLHEMKISGLIARSREAYIDLAISLANDSTLRSFYRSQIRAALTCNHPRFLNRKDYSQQLGRWIEETFRNSLDEYFKETFQLAETNIIIFPNWKLSEDELIRDFSHLFQWLLEREDCSTTSLLVVLSNISDEEAELFMSSIMMDILMSVDSVPDPLPAISFIQNLTEKEWHILLESVHFRLEMSCTDYASVERAGAENLKVKALHP